MIQSMLHLLLLDDDQQLHVKRNQTPKYGSCLCKATNFKQDAGTLEILIVTQHCSDFRVLYWLINASERKWLLIQIATICTHSYIHVSYVLMRSKTLCGLDSTTYTPGSAFLVLILPLHSRSLTNQLPETKSSQNLKPKYGLIILKLTLKTKIRPSKIFFLAILPINMDIYLINPIETHIML